MQMHYFFVCVSLQTLRSGSIKENEFKLLFFPPLTNNTRCHVCGFQAKIVCVELVMLISLAC